MVGPIRASEVNLASVNWSPDGSHLVTAGGDGTVRLYDANTGRQIEASMPISRTLFPYVTFSPDGQTIVATAAAAVRRDRLRLGDVCMPRRQPELDPSRVGEVRARSHLSACLLTCPRADRQDRQYELRSGSPPGPGSGAKQPSRPFRP